MSGELPDRHYTVNPDGTLTPTAPERRFALTKIDAGDWLMPGNDERTLWRITKGKVGYGGENGEIEYRPGWELFKWRYQIRPGTGAEGFSGDWDEWEYECAADTRAEAISEALDAEGARA